MWVCPECGATEPAPAFCPRDGSQLVDGGTDPLLGSAVGHYRLASVVGKGGMGVVYKGVNPNLGSKVAIKVISDEGWRDRVAVERFFAEARTVNLIRHENIVKVLDLGWLPDGRPHIVMEYVDGSAFSAVLRRPGALDARRLIVIGLEILDALAAAHAQGIVHRDLKPHNVVLTPAGHVKLLDFGIAKLRRQGETTHGLTAVGTILGTPLYMSPEQALGQSVDPRSDLYSFGIILYESLAGRVPFVAPSVFEILRQHVENRPMPLRALRPELPEALEQIVLRALAKNPAARPQSATELASMLQGVLATLPEGLALPARSDPAQFWQPTRPESSSLFAGDSLQQSGAMPSGNLSQPSWSGSMQATNASASLVAASGHYAAPARNPLAPWVAVGLTGALLAGLVVLVVAAGAFVWWQRQHASESSAASSQIPSVAGLTSAPPEGSIAVSTPALVDGLVPPDGSLMGPRAVVPNNLTPAPSATPSLPRVAGLALPDAGAARNVPSRTSQTSTQTQPTSQSRPVWLYSVPSGATVTMDGKYVGTTPIFIADAGPGYHEFGFKHPDYWPESLHMEVPVGNTKNWTTKFKYRSNVRPGPSSAGQ